MTNPSRCRRRPRKLRPHRSLRLTDTRNDLRIFPPNFDVAEFGSDWELRVARLTSATEQQTRINFRTKVEETGCVRPSWTANEAREKMRNLQRGIELRA